jgi:ABC-2 type transport system permease protein
MGKLMKYELFRRSKLLISILIVLVFMEGAAIYGLYRGDTWLVLFAVMLVGMGFAAFIVPLIDAVVNYYSDFKSTHGYLLFLTPQSGYSIIGSKALFALIELLAALALVAGFYTANFYLAEVFGYADTINTIQLALRQIPQVLGTSIGGVITLGVVSGILKYFYVIVLAIFAVTLTKTLLSQKSFNWLIALLLYFGLAMAIQAVNGLVFTAFGFVGDMMKYAENSDVLTFRITKYILIAIGLHIVWIGAVFTGSSMLINKRVDL